jgi:hypothetical protein
MDSVKQRTSFYSSLRYDNVFETWCGKFQRKFGQYALCLESRHQSFIPNIEYEFGDSVPVTRILNHD